MQVLKLGVCLLVSIGLVLPMNASAEYYVVYGGPYYNCSPCAAHYRHRVHKHKVKHHKPVIKRKVHKAKCYKPCRYGVTVTCRTVYTSCGCARSCGSRYRYVAPAYDYYYGGWDYWADPRDDYRYDSYAPDLSTGDDDATIHPEMNIDY